MLKGVKPNNNEEDDTSLIDQHSHFSNKEQQPITYKMSSTTQTLSNTSEMSLVQQQAVFSNNACTTLPGLPWWFTNECRQQLLSIPSFEAIAGNASSYATHSRSVTPDTVAQMTPEQLGTRLKHQLEYYFSRFL